MDTPQTRENKGFTLMELIAVVTVIGTMATLILPRYVGTIERVRVAEGVQFLTALLRAQKAFEAENPGTYTADCTDLDVEILAADNFV